MNLIRILTFTCLLLLSYVCNSQIYDIVIDTTQTHEDSIRWNATFETLQKEKDHKKLKQKEKQKHEVKETYIIYDKKRII